VPRRRLLLALAAATAVGVAAPVVVSTQAAAATGSTGSARFIGPTAPPWHKGAHRLPLAQARRIKTSPAPSPSPSPTPSASGPTVAPSPTAGAVSTVTRRTFRSGVYVGAGDPAKVTAFEAFRGSPADVVIEFLGDQDWQNIANPEWTVAQWDAFSTTHKLVYHVPLVPKDGSGTLAHGAAGAYDAYFTQLAQLLVRHGQGDVTLRLGAEMNLASQPWTIGTTSAGAASYAAYWRHVVTAMRAVPGAAFRFSWNVNNGLGTQPAENAYPGDAYVDEVAIDSYDWGWAPDGGPMSSAADRWTQIRAGNRGLDFWAAFAKQHGKQISVPEWGLVSTATDVHGGGDDPYYISAMHDWLAAQDLGYEAYFNWGDWKISGTGFPNASARYVDLWR
jgi:hypothetical protein